MINEKKILEELEAIRENKQYDAERHLHNGNEFMEYGCNCEISGIDKAIYLIEKQPQVNQWIPVSERLPENEKRVFICADRKSCKGEIIKIRTTAMYEDGTMHTEESGYCWEDCDFEYCEETDDYIIPEGWYEQNMYCEEFGIVDDFVTHWMPLPELLKGDNQ